MAGSNDGRWGEVVSKRSPWHQNRDWDTEAMEAAVLASKLSTCLRRHVGAVLVERGAGGQHIVAVGHNDVFGEHGGKCGDGKCPRCAGETADSNRCLCTHAEQRVIAEIVARQKWVMNATLFVTLAPCVTCAKLIVASQQIRRCIYLDGHEVNFDLVQQIFFGGGVALVKYHAA